MLERKGPILSCCVCKKTDLIKPNPFMSKTANAGKNMVFKAVVNSRFNFVVLLNPEK